eukprot:15485652-Alexandrium_andersonii.AAC.1
MEDVFGPLDMARPSASLRFAAPGGGAGPGAAHGGLFAEEGGLDAGAGGAGARGGGSGGGEALDDGGDCE